MAINQTEELKRVTAKRDALKRVLVPLMEYADHKLTCRIKSAWNSMPGCYVEPICNCGLDAALAVARAELEKL